jgi:hypothetical protein
MKIEFPRINFNNKEGVMCVFVELKCPGDIFDIHGRTTKTKLQNCHAVQMHHQESTNSCKDKQGGGKNQKTIGQSSAPTWPPRFTTCALGKTSFSSCSKCHLKRKKKSIIKNNIA